MNRRSFLQLASSSALLAGALPGRIFASGSSETSGFQVRGLELCGTGIWQWKSIDRALAIMERLGLNTLIVHQNDLPDYVVWPAAYFSADFMYARNPVRTDLTCDGRDYLREVARRAARVNISVFLEDKEIWYPDGLVELHPELMEIKGIVCPTHPFWWEYERQKYAELVRQVPGIAGVVVSPGTRESKVSFAVRNCACERCRLYDPTTWYSNLIGSIREPLRAAGKRLVVRDFAYGKGDQDFIVNACTRVSGDVVVSLTSTAHHFCQTFPANPRIGDTGGNSQWVEFDAAGQFLGMGVFPCSFVEDMRIGLHHARKNGAEGVWFRADVEFVSDSSVFNSPNLLNLFGGAMLSRDGGRNLDDVYGAWLAYGVSDPMKTESEEGDPVPVAPDDRDRFVAFMKASRAVLEKTLCVRGLVFTDGNGRFPDSVDRAFANMLVLHRREDWDPGASRRVDITDENLKAVFEEKERAEDEAGQLPGILEPGRMRLPAGLKASLATMLDLYKLYVTGFRRCTVACFCAKRAAISQAPEDIQAADAAADQLAAYRQEVARRLADVDVAHSVYGFFDTDHLDRLAADVREKMAEIRYASATAAVRG